MQHTRLRPGEDYGAQPGAGPLLHCRKSFAARRRNRRRLSAIVGETQAVAEVSLGIERIFSYAAWADKFDGAVHNPPFRNVALAMNEPLGTVGIACPNQAPLLGFLSLVMPVLAAAMWPS